jgi:hypothetical protein
MKLPNDMRYDVAMLLLQEARIHAPALVTMNGGWHVFSRGLLMGSGVSITDALTAAKVLPRVAPTKEHTLYTRHDRYVMHGIRRVAIADSTNMAQRIQNALNAYAPNEKGQ